MRHALPIFFLLSLLSHAQEKPRLTTVAELRALSPEEADRHLPALIRGVVTYVEQDYDMLYVQDQTGGSYVSGPREIVAPPDFDRPLQPGDLVEVEGVTHRGKFIPHLDSHERPVEIRVLGEAPLPAPVRPRQGDLFNPKLHNQWAEIEAFATDIRRTNRWLRVTMVLGGKNFQALIVGDWRNVDPPDLTGSDLRIRGVYGATFNEDREMRGMNLLVPSIEQIEVIDPGLTSAFSQPVLPIQDLRQFQPGPLERAHVEGTVTWSEENRGFYLTDGSAAVWVDPAQENVPPVGAQVEVVGFPSIDGAALRLRDAVSRPGEDGHPPLTGAQSLSIQEVSENASHGELVHLEAEVVDRLNLEHTRLLALTNGPVSFQARLVPEGPAPKLPPPGSWVGVTGVYERLSPEETGAPLRFQLLLRSPADIRLLREPSWWTVERIAWVAAGLAAIVLAALAWAVTLSHRVRSQTAIISQQIENQRLAEERSRIGRELHDTLEQYLTGVSLQIDTASEQLPEDATQARHSLNAASAMLSHSRQETRRSVWDLKNPILEQEGLPGALKELTSSRSSADTSISLDLPSRWQRLPEKTEFHLLRIAQEAVSNALKHAQASQIDIGLKEKDGHVELVIRDNGKGFDPSRPPDDGRLHFGLAGMAERAGKLNATLQLDSKPGAGATVTVKVPK